MIHIGIDWGETTNAVAVVDEEGTVLDRASVQDNVEGLERFQELVAKHTSDRSEVVIGAETDRGLLIQALAASGYKIYPVNPLSANRYRDRHKVSRAKSDPGDAVILANIVRTDRHNHRPAAINSELAEEIKVLSRRHQDLIWERTRIGLRLRSSLREYYRGALEAFGEDLTTTPCLRVLERAPTPEAGRRLTEARIAAALKRGGRQRNLAAQATRLHAALQAPQLELASAVSKAYGHAAAGLARILIQINAEVKALSAELEKAFKRHPDAEVIVSFPGLDVVLGARLLAEFGDEPNRYADSRSRKNYSGMSPITRRSGKHKVVSCRFAKKRRLANACYSWADCAYRNSPGAKCLYRQLRQGGATHSEAVRALANRLVGFLHACLRDRSRYDEDVAWPQFKAPAERLSA